MPGYDIKKNIKCLIFFQFKMNNVKRVIAGIVSAALMQISSSSSSEDENDNEIIRISTVSMV